MASEAFKKWWSTFARTGDICPLRLGNTREQVKEILGEPDSMGGISRKNQIPAIWRYEEIEFHFGPKPNDVLSLIYSEDQDGNVKVSLPRRS
jgi:hypothetical protein